MTLKLIGTLVLALTVQLVGCKPSEQADQMNQDATASKMSPAGDTVSVMTDGVNYMHERAVKYTLYDLSQTPPTPIGGAIVDMLIAGGEKGCCLNLPKTWRSGMKVRVVWAEADRRQTFPGEHTLDLEIPRYEEPADLYLVFHGQQDIEVVVSKAEPGHPEWRGRIKATPWEHCLAHNERKICKAALPKQFDTGSLQGYCAYTQTKEFPSENFNGKETCAAAMHQCMQDYEDDAFCKGILWGIRKK